MRHFESYKTQNLNLIVVKDLNIFNDNFIKKVKEEMGKSDEPRSKIFNNKNP